MGFVRFWHSVPNNPKFRVVAKRSGQSISDVLAVYVHMMVEADLGSPRGTIKQWDDESVGAALDLTERQVMDIRDAMQGKLLDVDRLIDWRKIRPPATDDLRPFPGAWLEIKRRILERDGCRCVYCGNDTGPLECDHVVPVSAGGSHEDNNLATACRDCNRAKSNKLLSEWRRD